MFPISNEQGHQPNDEREARSRKHDVRADRLEVGSLRQKEVAWVSEEMVESVLRDC